MNDEVCERYFDDYELYERDREPEGEEELEDVERPGFDIIGLILAPYRERLIKEFQGVTNGDVL